MRNLVLYDVSQDSAYHYTGITTFENLAEITGDYPFEEEVMEKAMIHKQTMMSHPNGISSFVLMNLRYGMEKVNVPQFLCWSRSIWKIIG